MTGLFTAAEFVAPVGNTSALSGGTELDSLKVSITVLFLDSPAACVATCTLQQLRVVNTECYSFTHLLYLTMAALPAPGTVTSVVHSEFNSASEKLSLSYHDSEGVSLG